MQSTTTSPSPTSSTSSYSPSSASLKHRANLAELFRPLKRVHPRVPFWELAAHRIPTLWSLYRGLLRNAPGEDIRWRMRLFFEQNRCLTSPKKTKEQLLVAHKWLDAFQAANSGDKRMQEVLQRYNSMIATKRTKERMKSKIIEAFKWQHRLLTRPILTGSYVRPTQYNGPLPRMHKDPEHVRMMMNKRRRAHERRGEVYHVWQKWKEDMQEEEKMWKELGVEDDGSGYVKSIADHQFFIRTSIKLDANRAKLPYPKPLLAQIRAARTERLRNKTHEKQRARRGERFAYTEQVARKRPPAHVWEQMSERRKEMEVVARGVGRVGYAGKVKRMLGWRMGKGDEVDMEVGKDEEDKKRLDEVEKEVMKVNEMKRRESEKLEVQ